MPMFGEEVAFERSRLFVGRRQTLQDFTAWASDHDAETKVWFISGMGGIGKSELLREIRRRAQRAEIPVTLCVRSSCRPEESPPRWRVQAEGGAEVPDRMVVLLDDYLTGQNSMAWLWDEFIDEVPSKGWLIVVASRQAPDLTGIPASVLHRWASYIQLPALDPVAVRQFSAGHPTTESGKHESVACESRGLPLILNLAVHNAVKGLTGNDSLSRQVVRSMRNELRGQLAEFFADALCVYHTARSDWIEKLLERSLSARECDEFTKLSFVSESRDGLLLHGSVRPHFVRDLLDRDRARFARWHRRAADILEQEWRSASARTRERVADNLLRLYEFEVISDSGSSDAPGSSLLVDMCDRDEIPVLRKMMGSGDANARGPSSDWKAQLFEAITREMPEAFRVVRAAPGEPPVAFHCVVPVTDSFDATPGHAFIRRLCSAVRAVSHGEQDRSAYIDCLSVNGATGWCSSREVANTLLIDTLALLSPGRRGWVIPEFNAYARACDAVFLEKMRTGFEAPRTEFIYAVDLTEIDFLKWLHNRLGSRSTPHLKEVLSTADLRTALLVLDDTAKLHRSHVCVSLNWSGERLKSELHTLLTATSPMAPLTSLEQELLRLAYIERVGGPDHVADRLFTSRATYYRHLRFALEHLAIILTNLRHM